MHENLEKVKLLARDLRDGKEFPRSPRATLAGYVLAARAVDKCRAVLVDLHGDIILIARSTNAGSTLPKLITAISVPWLPAVQTTTRSRSGLRNMRRNVRALRSLRGTTRNAICA